MPGADHYDIVIIGSGAGGGTLAWKLAPSGKRILLLERGGYLPRERDNWETEAVFLRGKYLTSERWLDPDGNDFTPEQNYNVGGNTKFYGAALFRLRPEDFGEITHHGGISPAWPIGYDELEPYYAQAEELYVVHGQAGEDPTDGPRSGAYPFPAVQHEPRIQQLSDDLEQLGLHPSHLPIGVMLDQDAAGEPMPEQPLHPLRPGRRLPVPGRGQSRRPGRVRRSRRSPTRTSTSSRNAKVERLETDAAGRQVTAVVATMADGSRPLQRRHRRRVVRRAQLGAAAVAVGQRRPPERAGERLGPGRAQLHAAQQRGDDGALEGA